MKTPSQTSGAAAPENAVSASPQKRTDGRSTTKGEIPASILDRYLIERDRQGRPEGFYRDHRAVDPMFKDEGKRLVTRQAYPDAVADMLKIAQHRGWSQVRVSGDEAFRREAWVQAQRLQAERGLSITEASIRRFFKRRRISFKKNPARQRADAARRGRSARPVEGHPAAS